MDVDGFFAEEEEPDEITETTDAGVVNLIPEKSKKLYKMAYQNFKKWYSEKSFESVTENVMLTYFIEKSKTFKCSTLWVRYSMIKSYMILYDNIDISKYTKLISFLKRNSEGYAPKKTKIFTRQQVNDYLSKADDYVHLLKKVVLIFGIAGGCRSDELVKLTIDNIEDVGSSVIITLPNSRTETSRSFVIVSSEGNINMVDFYRKYAALRPPETNHRRFFIFYKDGKCGVQPVGKNTMGKVPSIIANFLKLPNPQQYTGHCMRRSSASLSTSKRRIWWKSTASAVSYVENSVENKNTISDQILEGTSTINVNSNEKNFWFNNVTI